MPPDEDASDNQAVSPENDCDNQAVFTSSQGNKPKFDTNLSFATLQEIYQSLDVDTAKYDPFIGTILQGIGLESEIYKFQDANIDMLTFLNVTDEDLTVIGIQLSTTRGRILDGIRRFHKQEWKSSSLPNITNDPITMTDAINIMGNVANHLKVLAATLQYLNKELEKGPILLPMQNELQYSAVLLLSAKKSQVINEQITLELKIIHQEALKLRDKDGYAQADLITKWKPRPEKGNRTWRTYIYRGVLAVAIVGVLGVVKKRGSFSTLKFW